MVLFFDGLCSIKTCDKVVIETPPAPELQNSA